LFTERLVKFFLNQINVRVLIVPHTFGPLGSTHSDYTVCSKIFKAFEGKSSSHLHMITKEYNQSEVKGAIGYCNFFIGSRMHSCIAALSQGIPTAGISYSGKFLGVFDTIGAANMVIDARSIGLESAIQLVGELFSRRDLLRLELRRNVAVAKQQIRNTFAAMLQPGHSTNSDIE
jgi:colanic acid/amylovoran biosynthesis protein